MFLLLETGFDYPWYYRFYEVLDAAAKQNPEGIGFCHEQLVAHQVRTLASFYLYVTNNQ